MTRLRNILFLLALTLVIPAARVKAIVPPADYILCSCQLCATSDVDCQISPSGYSIACSDYYRLHCK